VIGGLKYVAMSMTTRFVDVTAILATEGPWLDCS